MPITELLQSCSFINHFGSDVLTLIVCIGDGGLGRFEGLKFWDKEERPKPIRCSSVSGNFIRISRHRLDVETLMSHN